ncbi:MAG: hypothetical protein GY913_21880 [Proteobacteria bacterium]|nr:hypothetical protein [Pseudomonadota bacterium]MCP4919561.1 hypothetical protein [Pseudomonadota bacterium]
MDDPTRSALRQLALVLGVAVPLAIFGFLVSADFFDNHHGEVIAWRPLDGATADSKVARFLVDRGGADTFEVQLPVRALSSWDLPRSPNGAIPTGVADDGPILHKDIATFSYTIDGKAYPTLAPLDLSLPFLFLVLVVLGRNLIFAGSPFRLVSDGVIRTFGEKSQGIGSVTPPPKRGKPKRPQKGPPPGGKKGRRGKRRR